MLPVSVYPRSTGSSIKPFVCHTQWNKNGAHTSSTVLPWYRPHAGFNTKALQHSAMQNYSKIKSNCMTVYCVLLSSTCKTTFWGFHKKKFTHENICYTVATSIYCVHYLSASSFNYDTIREWEGIGEDKQRCLRTTEISNSETVSIIKELSQGRPHGWLVLWPLETAKAWPVSFPSVHTPHKYGN